MFWKKKNLTESWKPILNFSSFSLRGCWGQPMLLFWKLVDETQISKPQEYTDTFKQNLTCIFLSVGGILKETYKLQENLVVDEQHSLYQVIPLKIIVLQSGRPFLMRETYIWDSPISKFRYFGFLSRNCSQNRIAKCFVKTLAQVSNCHELFSCSMSVLWLPNIQACLLVQ